VRLYSGGDRVRLEAIIKAKQLGFTLSEIAELLGTLNSRDGLEENCGLNRSRSCATDRDAWDFARRSRATRGVRLIPVGLKGARASEAGGPSRCRR
jgi:DNA-binding transcriptional MerR regulator